MAAWTDGVRRAVLPNGLTLLVQRDPAAPAAAVITHVKAGFFDEPDRWQGISHVLEHMYFKGTDRRGPGDIARETKAAGGYLNAGTSYDFTTYYVVLPAAALDRALDIQADALQRSRLDADELRRELGVIIEEARRKMDSPGAVTHETLHAVMFDRHRIRRWRIGREENLARFTREDVLGYYRSRYVPSRVIVSIAGDVDPDQALDQARRVYGDWADGEAANDPSPAEPPHRQVRARTLRGDVSHAHLALGWHAVPPLHRDAPVLDLASAVLATGRGSWLYRELRDPGLVTSAAAWYYGPTELGVFGAAAQFEPARLQEVLKGIAAAVRRLADVGPGEEDLERARAMFLTRWVRRLESTDGRASALAGAEALRDVALLDEEYRAIQAVTRDDIREAAARYLVSDGVAGVLYLPRAAGDDLDASRLGEVFRPRGVPRAVPLPPVLPPAPARTVLSRRVADVAVASLDGVDLLVRRKPGIPVVHVGIYLPQSGDPPGQAGLGALVARTAVRGAGQLDAAGLALAFERLGGALGVVVSADWLGFAASVDAGRLGAASQLLHLVQTRPVLRDEDIAVERGVLMEEARQVADDMFRFPFRLGFGAAFGDRGYGVPVTGLPETLESLDAATVRAAVPGVLQTRRPVVVAVGEEEPARALEILAGVFGDLPAREAGTPGPADGWAVQGYPATRVVQRDRNQTALAMLFPGVDRRDPERHAAMVLASVASGLGGRLFESLRSRRSLAYTVLASAWARGRAGTFLTYIATSPAREGEARAAMLEELSAFTRDPVTGEELAQAVNYLAGQALVGRQSGAALAGEILEAWLIGEGLEELEPPGEGFRRVTADAVLQVARRMLRPDVRAEGIVRGRTAPERDQP